MRSEKEKKRISKINIIMSLLISFAAWMYVVYNVHPTINKSFRDVPITFEGQYELAENGYAIDSAEKTSLDVTLKINRTDISKITSNDIEIIAQVGGLYEGVNNVQLQVNVPNGASIKNQEAGIISVDIKPVTCKDVVLTADYVVDATATINEDELSEPVLDNASYEKVSVYGTAQNLQNVTNATAFIDKASLSSSTSKEMTVKPVAVDKNGNKVKYITVFPSEVEIEAHKATAKKLPLTLLVKDEATDGLKRSYQAPSSVYVKGSAKLVNSLNSIETSEMNINGISKYTEIPLVYNLPDGVFISNRSLNNVLKVSIESKSNK